MRASSIFVSARSGRTRGQRQPPIAAYRETTPVPFHFSRWSKAILATRIAPRLDDRGRPFGDPEWVASSTLRPRGRPRVHFEEESLNQRVLNP